MLSGTNTHATQENEFIRDGAFELGIVDVDIVRYPRYSNETENKPASPFRDPREAISGSYSLQLPALALGGYRLVYRAMPLVAGQKYKLSLDVKVQEKPATIRLEAFTGWNRVGEKKERLNEGLHRISMNFNADSKTRIDNDEASFFFRIWVNGEATVWLDNVSLRGPTGSTGIVPDLRVWLKPDRNIAVYSMDENGHFVARSTECDACKLEYRIVNSVSNQTVANGNLKPVKQNNSLEASIPLVLSERGFFQVTAIIRDKQGVEIGQAEHSYAVINSVAEQKAGFERFGICMEEYGPQTQIDAFASPDDYYRLAKQIGVGTARVFTLLMPDMISKDGIRYDFTEADAAISLLKSYGIEPMIVLGSNGLHRIPDWMRSSDLNGNSIDLISGLYVPSDREKFMRKSNNMNYMLLDKYRGYLEAVFEHYKGIVKYYELWNEPGHKFRSEDFIRIAELTQTVRDQMAPKVQLIGYSSTRRGNVGAGMNPKNLPEFLKEMQEDSGLNYIDILSYHSEHAFQFMNNSPDHNNHETRYVPRIRTILAKDNKEKMPIWDTERGIPWLSSHKERLDYMAGKKYWKHTRPSVSLLDSARQLPTVYAAAFANNVERLFWFYFETSSGTIQRSNRRWGFFDAQREPTPHIPIYDAMTEILQEATFYKLIESKNGGRAYIFNQPEGMVILAYNWQDRSSTLQILQEGDDEIRILDIMGNPGRKPMINNNKVEIHLDKWPQYVLIPGIAPSIYQSISVH